MICNPNMTPQNRAIGARPGLSPVSFFLFWLLSSDSDDEPLREKKRPTEMDRSGANREEAEAGSE